MAVSLIVILVFLILLGGFFKEGEFGLGKGVTITLGIVIAIAVVIAVMWSTGSFGYLSDLFSGEGSTLLTNIVFIALIAIAVIVVVLGGKRPSSS